MDSKTHEKKDLVIAWTRQCFQAAGLETSEKEAHSYAATAANEIIEEGFAAFAEGNSVPHGSGSNTVAGGIPVPGFIAYLNRSVPADNEGRFEAFDEIFQRFVDLTATAEAAGESGVLSNAAYNRSLNAANEILQQYFELRCDDFVQNLHKGFGDDSTPPIDMSKVTVAKTMAGSGCAVVVLAMALSVAVAALFVAVAF
jgi:hypothetical protein